ncbi:OmpP1/FadL family transporter [Actibacterium ureilyticum]|uniref:OmpP1/FadL family transporter n=1 Tax=Actibacterium ureilyticum TaxID=1590614 RepID=UPI000BAA97A0|nr:outer membrane protein transport protein [Actibacterium ureilyticum]
MTRVLGGVAVAVIAATPGLAGGIERTTQSAQVLFEKGNYAEFSVASVKPTLDGEDVLDNEISNVTDRYGLASAALKFNINETLDAAIIFDKPFGADVKYRYDGVLPFQPALLDGTSAYANTSAITGLLKYKFNENFSAYGGIRAQQAYGEITLGGAAYGPFSGYNVELDRDQAFGYVAGVAYERPDIAMRIAFTYNSEIEHNMDTTESGALPFLNGTSKTKVKTPESFNLEFQSGIAADTLLFGSIRHVKHSQFRLDPELFVAQVPGGLIDLNDTTTYRLGIGRKFNEKWSGAITLAYEDADDKLVSPLAPSTGFKQISIGATYKATPMLELSGGISYTMVGDANPETGTPDTARAEFDNNDVVGIGFKVAYRF